MAIGTLILTLSFAVRGRWPARCCQLPQRILRSRPCLPL